MKLLFYFERNRFSIIVVVTKCGPRKQDPRLMCCFVQDVMGAFFIEKPFEIKKKNAMKKHQQQTIR